MMMLQWWSSVKVANQQAGKSNACLKSISGRNNFRKGTEMQTVRIKYHNEVWG